MSNDIPAVSVIIPVYNAAEFLKDGLNSLLKQTLREIEIICVDEQIPTIRYILQRYNRFLQFFF